ncbi:DNA processing protein DprA [Zoogloea ramigera]|uniref:DNA processing protein DprA n=1 Tax=Zoogloea ramigera TaxID=350 RepID=A0A4Y4CX78_ZOORA|nr:DNA-processing protein DprA [Zoogloea ramigera]GEC96379.1 DNA processing protein DprA [Zoogloea ramigera]
MPSSDPLAPWLRLILTPGVGPGQQRQLLAAFGPPEGIYAAGHSAIAAVIGGPAARTLLEHDATPAVEVALEWLSQPGNRLLTLGDEAYPAALLEIPDPPVALYVKGDAALLSRPSLAVVGARNATPQGEANAESFSRALSEAGLCIVSGLALGIDAAAHRGGLAGPGSTVAVIGTGADRIYPARNAALARQIAEAGVIVSEFPLGIGPLAHNFPRRNRLIAGLAQGVLVVEAALKSGSLITARLATDCGREVFAIPGSIHSPVARGCHQLIRDGAKLVETAVDILDELRLAPREAAPQLDSAPVDDEGDEAQVIRAMGHDPVDMDALVQRTNLTAEALYAILLALELDGRVSRLPGGRLQRL